MKELFDYYRTIQNLDESYKKNILWLLCSLSTNEDAKHCLAKVGIIPIAVDYLKSNSSSTTILIDHSLTILSNILIEDTYQTIFQHCDGVKFLLDFFSSGSLEQQALALNIFSMIGKIMDWLIREKQLLYHVMFIFGQLGVDGKKFLV